MSHDRIHAQKPDHDIEHLSVRTIDTVEQRDGHRVVTVNTDGDEPVELVATLAIRNRLVRRLELTEGVSPAGERVWFRKHGG